MSSTYRKSRTYVNARDASKVCVCVWMCVAPNPDSKLTQHTTFIRGTFIFTHHTKHVYTSRDIRQVRAEHTAPLRARIVTGNVFRMTRLQLFGDMPLNAWMHTWRCAIVDHKKSKHLNGFCHKVKRVADVDLHMDTHFTWMASQSAPRQHRAYICSYSYMFAKKNSKTSARAAKHIQNETPSTDYMVFAAVCRWLCVMWKGCAWWYGIQVHERARDVRTQWAMCAISQHHHYFNKDIFIERARECAFVQVYSRWALFALCVWWMNIWYHSRMNERYDGVRCEVGVIGPHTLCGYIGDGSPTLISNLVLGYGRF